MGGGGVGYMLNKISHGWLICLWTASSLSFAQGSAFKGPRCHAYSFADSRAV